MPEDGDSVFSQMPPERPQQFRDDAKANGDGWLMLGAGETAVGRTDLFLPAEGNQGLFTFADRHSVLATTNRQLRRG